MRDHAGCGLLNPPMHINGLELFTGPSAKRSGHAAYGQAWEPDLLDKWDSTALGTDSFDDKDRHAAGLNLDKQYSLFAGFQNSIL